MKEAISMASGKLKKYPTREALYRVANHNFRTKKNHSNKDINPELTKYNQHYGPQSAEEYRAKFRKMMHDADEKHPPRRKKKDRQTFLEVIVWSPREGMTPDEEAVWSQAAYKVLEELFPGQIVGGTYHADEVHEYTIDEEKHISRGHTHIGLIPWTDEKGLNMDAFYRRSLPNQINEALDKACMEMFGFPYRDGTGTKSKATVEELKRQSLKAENKLLEADNASLKLQNAILKKDAEKVVEKVYKPYLDAVERLKATFKALKPKEQEKEYKSTNDLIKNLDFKFGKKDQEEVLKATKAIEEKASQLEADYLTIVSDDDFEEEDVER